MQNGCQAGSTVEFDFSSGSKVELLFLGAFGAGEEMESESGIFGFD